MTSFYQQFETNKNIEVSGVWLDYGEGKRILISRAGGANQAFNRRMAAELRPYRRLIQSGNMDEKVTEQIALRVFCETVVKGWEGVTDRLGEPMQFNVENAITLFTDLPDLYADVSNQALSAALFKEHVDEQDLKN